MSLFPFGSERGKNTKSVKMNMKNMKKHEKTMKNMKKHVKNHITGKWEKCEKGQKGQNSEILGFCS